MGAFPMRLERKNDIVRIIIYLLLFSLLSMCWDSGNPNVENRALENSRYARSWRRMQVPVRRGEWEHSLKRKEDVEKFADFINLHRNILKADLWWIGIENVRGRTNCMVQEKDRVKKIKCLQLWQVTKEMRCPRSRIKWSMRFGIKHCSKCIFGARTVVGLKMSHRGWLACHCLLPDGSCKTKTSFGNMS